MRRHHFQEIAADNPVVALHYLQADLAETVDHSDAEETKEVGQRLVIVYLSQYKTTVKMNI